MSKIFDGGSESDSEVGIKTNNEFARHYDTWRKKEELNRFKTKYGVEALDIDGDESSSSSDDDDQAIELNEEVEKEFFKTLSYLKNKDPRIYDEKTVFFENLNSADRSPKKMTKKDKPVTIKDYERQLILEKNGVLSDDEDHQLDSRSHSPTYVENQKKLKDSLKEALESDDEHEDRDTWGGLLKARSKNTEESQQEEAEYKVWLAGQKDEIEDKKAEADLKPLKEYWSNPALNNSEKFLRDYILNKRFLSNDDDSYIPTYEEIVHDSDKDLSEDERNIEKQEEFEQKFNFRFEEPDQDFIKRYPRTIENSLRKTDDKRKLKRAELKERKIKEKEEKKQDLKKLRELKRQEIEEKIEKLKEITGNADIAFNDDDLDGDFDPEAYDKKMGSLFNDEFYQGHEEDQKPEFPELDQFLELENWDRWHGENGNEGEGHTNSETHCEDEDFNMDCDYDPTRTKNELIENSKGKKKRKRKSAFAKVVSQPKPVFDPNDKTYEQYMDEYYQLDCEDFIGDLPCRFKYRKVVPNSFGLSMEEILSANDRELNKWCSLKKAMQHRPDHVEKYDQIAFAKKAQNLALKKRVLPSLFKNDPEPKIEESSQLETRQTESTSLDLNPPNRKRKCSATITCEEDTKVEASIANQQEKSAVVEGTDSHKTIQHNSKKKKKRKNPNSNNIVGDMNKQNVDEDNKNLDLVKKKKRKVATASNDNTTQPAAKKQKLKIKKKRNTTKQENVSISDARLSAYGLNPKKFKNKMKYKNIHLGSTSTK